MTEVELDFTEEDELQAIGELKSGSAPGPDGVPAALIKNYAQALAIPLKSMWKWSLRVGIVPAFYKMSLFSAL